MGFNPTLLLRFLSLLIALTQATVHSRYASHFDVPAWSKNNVRSINKDHVWQLLLDNTTAPGFASKASYLFGSFDMNIKLIRGNSAGTVTAFYLASTSSVYWDELDFEFLGNESGQPYLLQTNVFWNGTGGREQRINLWFDPTSAYHNYSLLWNPQQIVFAVDGIPIRVVKNNENIGIPYLNKKPMRICASLWDGSTWATQGGLVKINWREAPFVVSFGQYNIDICAKAKAKCMRGKWWNSPSHWTLSTYQKSQLNGVIQNYMSYNYCNDTKRYPTTPMECLQQQA